MSPRPWRFAFAAVAVVHLGALAAPVDGLAATTKPLLMAVLVAVVLSAGAPRLLVAALVCGWAGDVLLGWDERPAFLAGMGAFAAGHVCYQVLFVRLGAVREHRRRIAVAACVYGVLGAAILAVLWPGLGELRVPVAVYSVLLAGTAALATGVNLRAAAGGALFLVSDTLIAVGLTDLPQPPLPRVCVMATYIAAQYLLAEGVLRARDSVREPDSHAPATMAR